MALEPEQSEHPATPPTPSTAPAGGDDGSNNHQLLIGALIVAGVIIAVLLMLLFGAGNPGRGGETSGPGAPGAIVTVPAPNPDQAQITVTAADGVNVRSGPGTDYPIVATLLKGYTVSVTKIDPTTGWLQVPLPGGEQAGWISGDPAYVAVK